VLSCGLSEGEVIRCALSLALVLGLSRTVAAAPPFTPPDAKGDYDVGTTTFSAVMSDGRTTKVQAYYPTASQAGAACDFYTVAVAGVGTYHVRSPLCARIDAPIAAGVFPLIVMDHGGGIAGQDIMAPMVTMYTVAFWEVFLAGHGHYMPYLTPGYAKRNGLPAVVEIEG
jgi:hypothetical protein